MRRPPFEPLRVGPRTSFPKYDDPAYVSRTLCTNPRCPGLGCHARYALSIHVCDACGGYVARCELCGGKPEAHRLLREHCQGRPVPDMQPCPKARPAQPSPSG